MKNHPQFAFSIPSSLSCSPSRSLGLLLFILSIPTLHAQTVNGAGGVDMGGIGHITNAPHISFISRFSTDENPFTWTHQVFSGYVAPVGQFTGTAMDGSNVAFPDLLPIRAQSLSVADSTDVTANSAL